MSWKMLNTKKESNNFDESDVYYQNYNEELLDDDALESYEVAFLQGYNEV